MKRAKKSTAWEHFKIESDGAKCKYCNAVLRYTSSTTSLLYHLNSQHPGIIREAAAEPASTFAQPTIPTMLAQNMCSGAKAESITQGICRMIEKDMMPIRMVEGEGFKELINIVQPRYSIPSRSAITRRIEK